MALNTMANGIKEGRTDKVLASTLMAPNTWEAGRMGSLTEMELKFCLMALNIPVNG
jgi:hypothetical protein